jgi:hypothetical protein
MSVELIAKKSFHSFFLSERHVKDFCCFLNVRIKVSKSIKTASPKKTKNITQQYQNVLYLNRSFYSLSNMASQSLTRTASKETIKQKQATQIEKKSCINIGESGNMEKVLEETN